MTMNKEDYIKEHLRRIICGRIEIEFHNNLLPREPTIKEHLATKCSLLNMTIDEVTLKFIDAMFEQIKPHLTDNVNEGIWHWESYLIYETPDEFYLHFILDVNSFEMNFGKPQKPKQIFLKHNLKEPNFNFI